MVVSSKNQSEVLLESWILVSLLRFKETIRFKRINAMKVAGREVGSCKKKLGRCSCAGTNLYNMRFWEKHTRQGVQLEGFILRGYTYVVAAILS